MADALATLSSMLQVNHWNHVPMIKVQRLDRPAHVFTVSDAIVQTGSGGVDNRPWYYDIKQFLQSRECNTLNSILWFVVIFLVDFGVLGVFYLNL